MQPHSMCAVALANYVWNSFEKIKVSSCAMNIEYLNRYGENQLKKYRLSNFAESSDRREFTVYIIRDGGGISCSITVRRNTTQEGAEVEMTHSQIHVSGLREVYRLMKEEITNGRHYNSLIYKDFKGEQTSSDRRKLRLWTDVKQKKDDRFVRTQYDLEITSIY